MVEKESGWGRVDKERSGLEGGEEKSGGLRVRACSSGSWPV